MTDQTLSDKIYDEADDCHPNAVLLVEDVKEAVRKLKNAIQDWNLNMTGGETKYYNNFDMIELGNQIDKIFGDKLI